MRSRASVRAIALTTTALTMMMWGGVAAAQDTEAAPDEAEANTARVTEAHSEDDVDLVITAGATGAWGNAQSIGANLAGLFTVREGQHAFLAEVSWLFGAAATRDPMTNQFGDLEENANNFNLRLRYDYFIDTDNALFVAARLRRDPFARLEPRFQGQIGYLRNFLNEENHRFWGEAGLDFTFDRFDAPLAIGGSDAAGNPLLSQDRGVGSLRLFIGYSNQLNEVLTYQTGFEFLWGPLRTVGSGQEAAMRFEWINQFRSKIEDWLQISLDLTARLDSAPPGQLTPWDEQAGQATQMLDILGTLNLVGSFDLDGEPAAEEEPEAEEPECPVCETCPVCEDCDAAVEAARQEAQQAADAAAEEEPSGAEAIQETAEEMDLVE